MYKLCFFYHHCDFHDGKRRTKTKKVGRTRLEDYKRLE